MKWDHYNLAVGGRSDRDGGFTGTVSAGAVSAHRDGERYLAAGIPAVRGLF